MANGKNHGPLPARAISPQTAGELASDTPQRLVHALLAHHGQACRTSHALQARLHHALQIVHQRGEAAMLLLLQAPASAPHAQPLPAALQALGTWAAVTPQLWALVLPNCLISVADRLADEIQAFNTNAASCPPSQAPRAPAPWLLGGALALPWLHSSPILWCWRAQQQLRQAARCAGTSIERLAAPDAGVSADEKHLLLSLSSLCR